MRPTHIEDYLMSLYSGQWFGWTNSKNKVYENLILTSTIFDSESNSRISNPYTKPTEQECIDGLAQLQADYDQAIIDREARKASAKAKLEALGLTTEEIKEAFGI
jgi:hypothetical protein